MAPRKKSGRAAAEAAYASLLAENTALVGDVGAAFEAFTSALRAAADARENYQTRRAAAVKSGAVTSDQLDQMGYRKVPRLPAAPTLQPAGTTTTAPPADPSPVSTPPVDQVDATEPSPAPSTTAYGVGERQTV